MIAFLVEAVGTLDSTQDELKRRVVAGEAVHGLVVRAHQQTAGRGRRARDFLSGLGGSYQTVAVAEAALGGVPPYAALAVGIGLAETLPLYGVRVGLKWPNDLIYRNKKLGGILTERVGGYLLIGVGVNVNNPLPEGATGLRGWDVEGAGMVVLAGVQRGLEHLLDAAFLLPNAFKPYDILRGRALEVRSKTEVYKGRGAGVDEGGNLQLEVAGEVRAFSSAHSVYWRRE